MNLLKCPDFLKFLSVVDYLSDDSPTDVCPPVWSMFVSLPRNHSLKIYFKNRTCRAVLTIISRIALFLLYFKHLCSFVVKMRLIASLAVLFLSFQNLDCQRNGRKLNPRLNFFDIELLAATAGQKKGNVMISPASVKSTLAMILAGADGDTAREIEQALRLSWDSDEKTEQLRWYLAALRANTTSTVLKNANGIFASKNIKLNPKYESVVKSEFQSEVTAVDFTDPAAAAYTINSWVSEHTHGLIPFVVEPVHVTPPNDLIIANALYFKSTWLYAFNLRETRSSCFFRDGECKMAAMMNLQTDMNYAHVEDLKAHAVELPYVGKRYSMILLVPILKDGIEGLIRDLPYVGFQRILDVMHSADVMLSMPRFTVNYNEDLVDALRKIHITTLFSNKSNLSKIFEGNPPQVNSFHHKVFMSVDENGTVAAASSAASVVPLMFDGSVQVRADRPFLFFIRDNELGVMLFEGKIEEPSVMENVVTPVVAKDHSIVFPTIENRMTEQMVQTSNTKPKTKSNSFVESLRNFFG